jgi:8-oxo-dGTP diphosphatase
MVIIAVPQVPVMVNMKTPGLEKGNWKEKCSRRTAKDSIKRGFCQCIKAINTLLLCNLIYWMSMEKNAKGIHRRPAVGMGIFVLNADGGILLGLRKNAHGDGQWSLPGGHMEWEESLFECAAREVKEETDLEIEGITKVDFTNDVFEDNGLHYITLFVKATKWKGEPKVMEPDKCEEWEWVHWEDFPENIFLPIKNLRKQLKHL